MLQLLFCCRFLFGSEAKKASVELFLVGRLQTNQATPHQIKSFLFHSVFVFRSLLGDVWFDML